MRRPVACAMLAAALFAACQAEAQMMYTYAAQPSVIGSMSDEDLEYTVAKALAEDESLRGASITLRVVDHRIVLEGIALSNAQARQAKAVAENAVKPEMVVADIEVAR